MRMTDELRAEPNLRTKIRKAIHGAIIHCDNVYNRMAKFSTSLSARQM